MSIISLKNIDYYGSLPKTFNLSPPELMRYAGCCRVNDELTHLVCPFPRLLWSDLSHIAQGNKMTNTTEMKNYTIARSVFKNKSSNDWSAASISFADEKPESSSLRIIS
jgi:hypothetical protein